MIPTIQVDLSKALVKFGESGIPENVRNNLRRMLPPLVHHFTNALNNRINTQLKTRRTITVTEKMKENPREITATVAVESPSAKGLLPTYLELGTKAHTIVPVNATFLRFSLGGVIEVYARKVHHPGTRPYLFMEQTVAEYTPEIRATMTRAVREGAAQ